MAKLAFYVLVFAYMCYRAVYGVRFSNSISVDQIHYGDDGFLEVGIRKTVNCKAPNKNHRLEWIDPFGNVIKRITSNRVFAQEHFVSSPKGGRSPGLVLTFSELMVSDSGIYQCKSGEQKRDVPVCVIKPSEFVETPLEVTVEAGRSISLACQARGDPEPRLVWFRDEEEITEGVEHPKYRVNRKYNRQGYESYLTITSLEPEDEGIYRCDSVQESPMLDNCTYSDSTNITLHVNYAPRFKNGNNTKLVYGKYNDVVDIKCAAKGWPKPTYRWFKDLGGDTLYEFDKTKIKFSEEPHMAILSVIAGPTTFENRYKCVASNSLGDDEKYFQLLKREKPARASDVKVRFVYSNSLHFKVTWDDEIYFPIEAFEIQYIDTSKIDSEIPSKSEWKKAKIATIEVDEDELDDSEDIIVVLNNLEPSTEYVARLRATNAAGEALWSSPISESTSEEAVTEANGDTEVMKETIGAPMIEPGIDTNTGMFYGIFFAGGIMVLAAVCMFAMRMV